MPPRKKVVATNSNAAEDDSAAASGPAGGGAGIDQFELPKSVSKFGNPPPSLLSASKSTLTNDNRSDALRIDIVARLAKGAVSFVYYLSHPLSRALIAHGKAINV
jgi:hypothetical protein